MKVLVTGATGYIGNSVAKTLSTRGHIVYGLYRNDNSLPLLLQSEIIPVKGSVENVKELEEILRKVEVVVDTATSGALAQHNLKLFHFLHTIGKATGREKKYIYTSGCLVCGETKIIDEEDIKDEEDPLLDCPPNFQWRKKLENDLINHVDNPDPFSDSNSQNEEKNDNNKIGGAKAIVIRPGFVYGGRGGHYAVKWFEAGEKNAIKVIGNAKKRWGWVHYEDLGEAVALISESSSSLVANQIFHITDDSRYSFEQIVIAMGRAAGGKGEVEYIPDASSDPFHSFVDIDAVVSSEKIKRVLNWAPRHPPFLDRVSVYYRSYLSFKSIDNSAH